MIPGQQDEPPQRLRARLRAAKRARIRRITRQMLIDGLSPAEIAASENISRRRFHALLGSVGLVGVGRARSRTLVVHVRDVDLGALDALAEQSGLPKTEVLTKIILAALDANGRPARRLLGKMIRGQK